MSVVISNREIIEDDWRYLDDSVTLPEQGQLILSPDRLRRECELNTLSGYRLGLDLDATVLIEEIASLLPLLDLVVLKFEGFSDGRAFSQARLLRERYRFTGEIRARGEVLRDQLSFMQRCGFTEFELEDNTDIKLALSSFGDISHSYQPELE